jgi:hypothetical protein
MRGLRKRMKKEKRKSNLVRQIKEKERYRSPSSTPLKNGNGLSFFVNL